MAKIISFADDATQREHFSYRRHILAHLEASHALFTASLASSKSDGDRAYNRSWITEVERRMKDIGRAA